MFDQIHKCYAERQPDSKLKDLGIDEPNQDPSEQAELVEVRIRLRDISGWSRLNDYASNLHTVIYICGVTHIWYIDTPFETFDQLMTNYINHNNAMNAPNLF